MTVDAVSGIWQYAMTLGLALKLAGCQVVFAGLGPRPTAAQAAEANDAGMLVWGDAPLDRMVRRAERLRDVGPWLAGVLRLQRPDLVQVNLPTQAAGLQTDIPVVGVCHSCLATWFRAVEGTAAPPALAWHDALMRAGLDACDAVVAPSAAQARATEAAHGIAGIVTVANATALAPCPPGGGTGVVAAGQWWDRGKNGDVLVAAADLCRWSVRLVGATAAADGRRLETGQAEATGPLPHDQAVEALAAAGIVVAPSLYEPFGLAALDAARLGRPLVLSDIPTHREIWDGAAEFFDPRDAPALAALLDRLAAAPRERRRLGAAAQARSADFTPDRQAQEMLGLYRRLTAAAAV